MIQQSQEQLDFLVGVQRGPHRCAPLSRMLVAPSSRLAIAESQPAPWRLHASARTNA